MRWDAVVSGGETFRRQKARGGRDGFARRRRAKKKKKKKPARTVVFPVVGQAEQQTYASRRGSRDERVERDQEPLVVLSGRRLKRALLLPPLVLERPHAKHVEVELLRGVQYLLDPVVLVAALVRAAGVHQVVAVRAGDVERRAVAGVDEPTALRGDDARRGARRGGTERSRGGDLADGNEEREKKAREGEGRDGPGRDARARYRA